jgi:hypothetical protein
MDGRYWLDRNTWVAEVRGIDWETRGNDIEEALRWVKDGIESLIDVPDFTIEIQQTERQKADFRFTVKPSDPGLFEAFSKWRKHRQSRTGVKRERRR